MDKHERSATVGSCYNMRQYRCKRLEEQCNTCFVLTSTLIRRPDQGILKPTEFGIIAAGNQYGSNQMPQVLNRALLAQG
jgi:hypothetical protein